MKSKQAGWDRVNIRSTKYLFCCKITGLLENSYHNCALGFIPKQTLIIQLDKKEQITMQVTAHSKKSPPSRHVLWLFLLPFVYFTLKMSSHSGFDARVNKKGVRRRNLIFIVLFTAIKIQLLFRNTYVISWHAFPNVLYLATYHFGTSYQTSLKKLTFHT